jgi:arsenate reductase (glutaredoxin)
MIQIFGTKKCKGTRAAQRFFADRRVPVQFINLAEKGLSKGELTSVSRAVGGLLALYDPAKDSTARRVAPSEAQLEKLLVEQPTCLRTPIVRDGAKAVLGADQAGWLGLVDGAKG